MSQELCSSQTVGCGHCGNLEMPTVVSGWVRVGGCFPAMIVKALPAHAGDTASLPVIACPGICGYVLGAV